MTTRVKWVEDRVFIGTSGSGHAVVMEAKGPGEGSVGPSPMEMLLLGLGGCSSFDVVHILGRMRENVEGCEVEIDGTRADEDPKIFTKIHLHFIVSGRGLKVKKAEQAVEMSAEKYCSASIMLGAMAQVTHDVEVIDLGAV